MVGYCEFMMFQIVMTLLFSSSVWEHIKRKPTFGLIYSGGRETSRTCQTHFLWWYNTITFSPLRPSVKNHQKNFEFENKSKYLSSYYQRCDILLAYWKPEESVFVFTSIQRIYVASYNGVILSVHHSVFGMILYATVSRGK